jgi:FixJ family two-component response regulator
VTAIAKTVRSASRLRIGKTPVESKLIASEVAPSPPMAATGAGRQGSIHYRIFLRPGVRFPNLDRDASIHWLGDSAVINRVRSQSDAPPKGELIVYIVDDDPLIRETLSSLLRSVGLQVRLFGSAPEFLQSELEDAPSCLVLDIRLPGLGGFDLQEELAKANIHIPIVFLTGHSDVPMSVRAMKAGAVDFLTKPFRDQDLLDAVSTALKRDQERRQYEMRVSEIRARFKSLTPREQQLMTLVTAGLLNKQIAAELRLSEGTVKLHRTRLMKKMGTRSLTDLVRIAEMLGLAPAKR